MSIDISFENIVLSLCVLLVWIYEYVGTILSTSKELLIIDITCFNDVICPKFPYTSIDMLVVNLLNIKVVKAWGNCFLEKFEA